MAANMRHQCKKYAEVFNVLPRQRSLFSFFCVDIAAISKGEHDSPSDEMLHVLLEKTKSKSVHLHCPTTEKRPLWPSGGISNGHSPFPSELQLSCLLTNNQILKMGGRSLLWWGIELLESRRCRRSERRRCGNHTAEVSGWLGAAATRWTDGSAGSAQPGRRRDALHGGEKQRQITAHKDVLDAVVVVK